MRNRKEYEFVESSCGWKTICSSFSPVTESTFSRFKWNIFFPLIPQAHLRDRQLQHHTASRGAKSLIIRLSLKLTAPHIKQFNFLVPFLPHSLVIYIKLDSGCFFPSGETCIFCSIEKASDHLGSWYGGWNLCRSAFLRFLSMLPLQNGINKCKTVQLFHLTRILLLATKLSRQNKQREKSYTNKYSISQGTCPAS